MQLFQQHCITCHKHLPHPVFSKINKIAIKWKEIIHYKSYALNFKKPGGKKFSLSYKCTIVNKSITVSEITGNDFEK